MSKLSGCFGTPTGESKTNYFTNFGYFKEYSTDKKPPKLCPSK